MKAFVKNITLIIAILLSFHQTADGKSFALDSIAEWGKFPRFCVNTYRWGDRFFNGYDTTYVVGNGYKFNVKIATDSWVDGYNFELPDKTRITMHSDPSSSVGLYLTYLAVSVGYDVNISKLLGNIDRARKRFRFGFNCSLFATELYYVSNNVGTTISRFGKGDGAKNYNFPFKNIDNTTFGIDTYYFFNHKKYSEAAAFNYSRIQKKSQGSFYGGFSFYSQELNFDFSTLPEDMKAQLPNDWLNYSYRVNTKNYALRFGYGYNWVFAPKWLFVISESPVIGLRKGFVNSVTEKTSFSIYNHLKMGIVWNSGRWFSGITGKFDVAILSDKSTVYAGGVLSGEIIVGYRFNLF